MMDNQDAQVAAARRIAVAIVDAARTGRPMSLARFVDLCVEAGVTDSEGILRTAIRAAYFAATIAAGALNALDTWKAGLADQFLRDLKVRTAAPTN
jgi:hypothetical protein